MQNDYTYKVGPITRAIALESTLHLASPRGTGCVLIPPRQHRTLIAIHPALALSRANQVSRSPRFAPGASLCFLNPAIRQALVPSSRVTPLDIPTFPANQDPDNVPSAHKLGFLVRSLRKDLEPSHLTRSPSKYGRVLCHRTASVLSSVSSHLRPVERRQLLQSHVKVAALTQFAIQSSVRCHHP